MTDPVGNEGIIVMVDEDDATEAASGSVAVYEEELVMETGSWVGVRFREIPIPRYSVIKSAHVEFTAAAQGHDPTEVKIWVENSTETDAFSEGSGNVSSRTLTAGSVDWILDNWTPNAKYTTEDFADLVQEIVNNDYWGVGDERSSLVVLFETNTGLRQPMSSETGDDTAPKLLIEYASLVTAALDVCLGETIPRCGFHLGCEETPHREIILAHCQNQVRETFTGLVTAAGYVAPDAQISCEPKELITGHYLYDAQLSQACEADCLSNPLDEDNFDPEEANACLSEAVQYCRDNGISYDECAEVQECFTTYLNATHAGEDVPICVADGPGSDTAMPLVRQLFGQRTICDVEGETTITVTVDGESKSPEGGPAFTEGRLTIFGGPCPGAKCPVGFDSKLEMENIEFDVIFRKDPVFKYLAQTAITYPGVVMVGDGTGGVVANRSVEAVGRGARGEGDEVESGIFFGTNDSTNSVDPLKLTVNWAGKTCGLAGDLLRSVDAEGEPAHCEGDGTRECFRDSDCGVGPCVTPEEGEPYCAGDVTTTCNSDSECDLGPCGDLPQDEGVLEASALYDGVLLNQPPRADAGGTQPQVECTSYDPFPGAEVELVGIDSSDPDHDISMVSWLKGSRLGPNVGDTLVATNRLALNEPTDYTLRVIDAYAQADEDTTMVVVRDTTSPEFDYVPPDVTAECTAPDAIGTAVDLGTAQASDICDEEPNVSNNAPERFTLGDTTVTWTATDDDENDVSADQLVTVEDTTPPEIFCNAPATINPTDAGDDKTDPEDRPDLIEPVAFTATAVDICDPEVPAVITEFDCFAFTKKGKRIDKTDSCEVAFWGDTITIFDTGGVGTHISWTVTAEDDTGNPPNTSEVECEVEVINPLQ